MSFCELAQLILVHVEEVNRLDTTKINFAISRYTQILKKICSQYKRISKSVLIIQKVFFLVKYNFNFTEIRLHKICWTPIMYTINVWL
jgi:hypothetical protein